MLRFPGIDPRVLLRPFILLPVLEVQLRVLKSDHILDLKINLVIVVLLLLTFERLQLKRNLKLVLEPIDVMLLYYREVEGLMRAPFVALFRRLSGAGPRQVCFDVIDGEQFLGLEAVGSEGFHFEGVLAAD